MPPTRLMEIRSAHQFLHKVEADLFGILVERIAQGANRRERDLVEEIIETVMQGLMPYFEGWKPRVQRRTQTEIERNITQTLKDEGIEEPESIARDLARSVMPYLTGKRDL